MKGIIQPNNPLEDFEAKLKHNLNEIFTEKSLLKPENNRDDQQENKLLNL